MKNEQCISTRATPPPGDGSGDHMRPRGGVRRGRRGRASRRVSSTAGKGVTTQLNRRGPVDLVDSHFLALHHERALWLPSWFCDGRCIRLETPYFCLAHIYTPIVKRRHMLSFSWKGETEQATEHSFGLSYPSS